MVQSLNRFRFLPQSLVVLFSITLVSACSCLCLPLHSVCIHDFVCVYVCCMCDVHVCILACWCVWCEQTGLLLSGCLSPHRHTNQCYASHEPSSSQAVTRRPVGRSPLKDSFIMQLYSDLEGQGMTMLKPMPVNQ